MMMASVVMTFHSDGPSAVPKKKLNIGTAMSVITRIIAVVMIFIDSLFTFCGPKVVFCEFQILREGKVFKLQKKEEAINTLLPTKPQATILNISVYK